MGFKIPFINKNKQNPYYLGFYLTDASMTGFIFNVETAPAEVIATNTATLGAGFERLIEDADNVISDLEDKTNIEISQTIFFLHSWMIDDDSSEIKEPYKSIIKKLCKELELVPVGYIDVKESIHEKIKSVATQNIITLEVNKTKLGVTVYRGGKNVFANYVSRTDNAGEDVSSILKTISDSTVLPTKIMLYGSSEKAQVSSELANYDWDQELFTQHPIISIFDERELNNALANTFSTEVLAKSEDLDKSSTEPTHESLNQGVEDVQTQKDEANYDAKSEIAPFGFVVGKDISESSKNGESDLVTSPPFQVQNTNFEPPVMTQEIIEEEIVKENQKKEPLLSKLPSNNIKKPLIFGIITAVLIFIIFITYEYFFHKMEITVNLKSIDIEKTLDINTPFSEDGESGVSLVAVKKIKTQSYEDEKSTSGSREEGEKATGQVEIKNYDKEDKTFARGTKLKKGSLIFYTDSAVTVKKSSSETASADREPGKVSVSVTAEAVGPDYNISKGSELSVADLSSSLLSAFATESFTGGSKKEIRTISKADISSLEEAVEKQVDSDETKVLGASISSSEVLLADLTKVSISDKDFSGEVGEEADKVNLKAKSETEYITINKESLINEIAKLLKEDTVPDGYFIDKNSISFDVSNTDEKNSSVDIEIDVTGHALQSIDSAKIIKDSSRKSASSLKNRISDKYGVEVSEINQTGGSLLWSPIFSKNIEIKNKSSL